MDLTNDHDLANSPVVANCRMNRERNLHGTNGYDRDLRFDPIEFLSEIAREKEHAAWLDLCCGTARALIQAATICDSKQLPVKIVGVDLVGMFAESQSDQLELVVSALDDYHPNTTFDLITCVHGVHYIGDKLKLADLSAAWIHKTSDCTNEPTMRFLPVCGNTVSNTRRDTSCCSAKVFAVWNSRFGISERMTQTDQTTPVNPL